MKHQIMGELIDTKYKKISIVLLTIILINYLLVNSKINLGLNVELLNYWIVPILWILMVIIVHCKIPRIHSTTKNKYKQEVLMWAFNASVAYVMINLGAGLIEEFGKSPYEHTLMGILKNTLYIGGGLIGREYIRSYVVHSFSKKNNKLLIPLMTLFMTLTDISLMSYTRINDSKSLTIFAAERFLPSLCENLLVTYLVLYGGAKASLIYLAIINGFEWLSPILPNTSWLAKGVVGIAVPITCLLIITNKYGVLCNEIKQSQQKEESIWKFLPMAVICILIVWFTAGIFPIYPSAIATGSMKPIIDPGDIVLVKKVQQESDIDQLQTGDIIQFQKGDNNSVEDKDLVEPTSIKGVIVKVIPKLGWPTLILKGGNEEVKAQVEF